jgi:hypothetical protein
MKFTVLYSRTICLFLFFILFIYLFLCRPWEVSLRRSDILSRATSLQKISIHVNRLYAGFEPRDCWMTMPCAQPHILLLILLVRLVQAADQEADCWPDCDSSEEVGVEGGGPTSPIPIPAPASPPLHGMVSILSTFPYFWQQCCRFDLTG